MLQDLESTHIKSKLLSTPSMPDDLIPVQLSDNARQVLNRRYIRSESNGDPIETAEQMFWRVAYHIAATENKWGENIIQKSRQFYDLLVKKQFFPNSPTFTGAGTPLGQLAACFVLPVIDDMGRKKAGIFQTLRDAALIQQTGGGNGFSFSRLRPKGTYVKSSAGIATGPVGFLSVYDQAFGEIAQGGTRRGANMAVLRVDHPDIEDFISCKTDENAITNFNISIGITDEFMDAVDRDALWPLVFPDVNSEKYKDFSGTIDQAKEMGIPLKTYRTVSARELFNRIVHHAHNNGEPGVLFLDTANRSNPLPHLYQLEATNPCGEQWLGPYENCCLGSINLAQHLGSNCEINWGKLRQTINLSTIFLDDVIDANAYVPAVPQLSEAAKTARRIGLGIMGLADLMYHCQIRYGSKEGQEFAANIIEFIRYHAMLTSIELAKVRGSFPAIKGSIYDPMNLTWQPPTPLFEYTQDWGRPNCDWQKVRNGIKKYGIRNAAQTTIAPTGTIATIAGCEGYGCEPVFALAYVRHVDDNGRDLSLSYSSPLFRKALHQAGVSKEATKRIINKVIERGTCQGLTDVPNELQEYFVTSQDISAEEHVGMQAAMQVFVDNSLSKTINFPRNASEEDIAKSYYLAWKKGCKGITVYVTGSRNKVVLETKSLDWDKDAEIAKSQDSNVPEMEIWHDKKKPRPSSLSGFTYNVSTPLGKAFITINENGGNQPFEVFVNTAKAGSETAAVSEAIGRLISFVLRLASPVAPRERLKEIWRQLSGIGGGRSLGFGPNRIRSLPDGVARALAEYLEASELDAKNDSKVQSADKDNGDNLMSEQALGSSLGDNSTEEHYLFEIGDLCPDCGQAAVVNEEGCRKCYACNYSEC